MCVYGCSPCMHKCTRHEYICPYASIYFCMYTYIHVYVHICLYIYFKEYETNGERVLGGIDWKAKRSS